MSKTAEVGEAAVRTRPADAARSTFLSVGRAVWFLTAAIGVFFASGLAHAEVDSFSIDAGAAVPLGAPYLIYGRYPLFGQRVSSHRFARPGLASRRYGGDERGNGQ